MRVAVLIKQVPQPVELTLVDGRLVREGVALETSAFCRRANARALALAGEPGDEVVVFTMGPPSAEDSLREMVACGADRGILVSDRLLAGSDTLVTARVLAAAIRREGRFDLILTGAYSLDSETGHVGVQVAENLGLPFVGPCRELDLTGGAVIGTVESEGGFVDVEVLLPAVASAAERLCSPSKASPERIRAVPADRITVLRAADLGFGPGEVGLDASPTRVRDALRGLATGARRRLRTASVPEALAMLRDLPVPAPEVGPARAPSVPVSADRSPVWCVVDPTAATPDRPLIAAGEALATAAGRPFLAVTADSRCGVSTPSAGTLLLNGPDAPEDWAAALADRLRGGRPHAVVIEGTNWGRELGARLAARLGWGLVGDAVDLTVDGGAVLAWKSAFSGQAMVPITSVSPTLLVTVRPGSQAGPVPAESGLGRTVETIQTSSMSRVIYSPARDVDREGRALSRASRLVVVGAGVSPDGYPLVERLRARLDAGPVGATRRVTDNGWLPRSRQIGITGRSVAPELLVSIAASGRFNHAVGFRRASVVVAINQDPGAPIFEHADIGIVGDWRGIVAELTEALGKREPILVDRAR